MDTVFKRKSTNAEQIRLDAEGNWFHADYPVLHDRTVQYLHKNIELDSHGKYYLGGEDKPVYIRIDEVPFFITKIERTIAGYLISLTNGQMELLDLNTLWSGKQNALYCLVSGGKHRVKFFRAPYYDITKDVVKKGKKYVIVFGKKEYPIQSSPPKNEGTKRRKDGRQKTEKKTIHAKPLKKAAKKRPTPKKTRRR